MLALLLPVEMILGIFDGTSLFRSQRTGNDAFIVHLVVIGISVQI